MSRGSLALLLVIGLLVAPAADARKKREKGARKRKPKPTAEAPAAAGLPVPEDTRAKLEELVGLLMADSSRTEARAQIVAMGPSATPYLLTRFLDPEFTIRWEMVNIQGDIQDPRAVPALVDRVLRDDNAHVRWRAIWALNEYPETNDPVTLKLLREAFASDDAGLSWNAAVGMSMFDAKDSLPALHAGLTQEDSWRRWEAINALGRLHDGDSARLLGGVYDRGDVHERSEAVMSLGNIGGADAVAVLVRALADASPQVRWRAVMQLGSIGDASALQALETLSSSETDPDVREHLDRVLGELRAKAPPARAGS